MNVLSGSDLGRTSVPVATSPAAGEGKMRARIKRSSVQGGGAGRRYYYTDSKKMEAYLLQNVSDRTGWIFFSPATSAVRTSIVDPLDYYFFRERVSPFPPWQHLFSPPV